MVSHKNNLFLIFLGLLLILSIFTAGKGTIKQVSSSVPIPSVGLVATWVNDIGYNETVEIVDENSTHFFLELYPNDSLPISSVISKDVWVDYSYLWDFGQPAGWGWAGWISVDRLTVGENVTLGDVSLEVIGVDYLTIPLGTFPVFIINTTDGRLYNYHVTTGLLLGYDSGEGLNYLLTTNGDLSKSSSQDETNIPFVGYRAAYLYTDVNGTILLNETVIVTGENVSHYFVDMFGDGSLIDQSSISKFIWTDRVYLWTFVSLGFDLGWPLWINVNELTLGENVTLGMESFQVTDKVNISVPVGDFEVWNISRPLENSTYWYEVSSGLLIAYTLSDEYHYLDDTNALIGTETTTTVITTTTPETTTETIIPEPQTTDPIIGNSTTTTTEDSTSSETDTTTEDDDSSTTEELTAPSISPGFSLPIVLIAFGIFYWIYNSRKK